MLDVNSAQKPRLSFSTLGCPDWPLDKIISFAAAHHYEAVELRGILRELDLTKSPAFASADAIKKTVGEFKKAGLKIASLDASTALHYKDPAARAKALDEGKRFIELAHNSGTPNIRVFPNEFPKDVPKEETMQLMTAGLSELGKAASGSGVRVLMETHGALVHAADIESVISAADHQENIGLVWDVSNMWTITGETPAAVYARLKRWIRHTHLKDVKKHGAELEYTMFGAGEVPIFEAIDLLRKDGFSGYYSFEWEKLWHPEIAAPEVAIAQFAEAMEKHFAKG